MSEATLESVLAGEHRWAILHDDCIGVLRKMPDCSVDAVVTDPPAGIEFMGKSWDSFSVKAPTASGAQTDQWGHQPDNPYARRPTPRYRGKTSSSLIGFQDFIAEVFAEVLRVLKPGGHAVVWSLPRTSHHTGMGLERAGFEVRDCITHFKDRSPELRAFLASLTPEQAELLVRAEPSSGIISHLFGSGFPKSLEVSKAIDKVAGPPATDAAKAWSGWGTALKPAAENWWLVRKPLEGTVAENVLRHGTGAVNVDGCRIKTSDNLNGGAYSGERRSKATAWQSDDRSEGKGSGFRQGIGEFSAPTGRWPANVLLGHSEACVRLGSRTVKNVGGKTSGSTALGQGSGWNAHKNRQTEICRTDDEVGVFRCAEGCPVAELDRQSGQSKSRKGAPRAAGKSGDGWGMTATGAEYDDSGGASRFFNTFEPGDVVPFFYSAKPSSQEKNAGAGDGSRENTHPTVKGQALMRHFVRLVTPPGGVVLDPFAGSGSTIVAAITDGFRCIGVEREEEYVAIARSRAAHANAVPKLAEPRPGRSGGTKRETAVLDLPLFSRNEAGDPK